MPEFLFLVFHSIGVFGTNVNVRVPLAASYGPNVRLVFRGVVVTPLLGVPVKFDAYVVRQSGQVESGAY